MSVMILSTVHHVTIGYILATIDNRHRYLYETVERAKKASLLNIQSYNARYNARVKREKIEISEFQMIDFKAISDAQKAMAIDSYIYQCDNAKGFDNNKIIKKLLDYRETLQFYSDEYENCDWFINALPMREPKSHETFVAEFEAVYCVSAKW